MHSHELVNDAKRITVSKDLNLLALHLDPKDDTAPFIEVYTKPTFHNVSGWGNKAVLPFNIWPQTKQKLQGT